MLSQRSCRLLCKKKKEKSNYIYKTISLSVIHCGTNKGKIYIYKITALQINSKLNNVSCVPIYDKKFTS